MGLKARERGFFEGVLEGASCDGLVIKRGGRGIVKEKSSLLS